MRTALGYVGVSTDEQAECGLGLEAQDLPRIGWLHAPSERCQDETDCQELATPMFVSSCDVGPQQRLRRSSSPAR
jgi:hypothetical protein